MADKKPIHREWFVTYEITERAIRVTHFGDDPVDISPDEAGLLRDELLAAIVAQNEHAVLEAK